MEKSINIHRALRTILSLLLTSILSIVFGAVGVVVGLLAEIVAGILHTLWAIVLYVLSVMMSPFASLQLAVNGAAMYVYRICDVFYRHILFQQYRNLCVEVN